MSTQEKTKYSLCLIALVTAYFYFSSPDDIVINGDGEINGFINKGREFVQGPSFWDDQLVLIDNEIIIESKYPEQQAQDTIYFKNILLEEKQEAERFYREYPELRPTQAEIRAQNLRDMADEVESREFEVELLATSRERLKYLRALRLAIESE